ncbi:SDR family NAD(P)-dependent oxidoreductase [Micromonospora rubida]|uniref:SDR family NAD(P)-dependent oxidoreductase n=1 Tax=Micromonospora rubida TaxID=2697657 RepID=A0ABW7SF65_9ACTN
MEGAQQGECLGARAPGLGLVDDEELTWSSADGYGLEGTFEEPPLSALRAQFDVNVFGTAATIQAVLPFMRERRRGHILAVTSMGGLASFPGVSAYCGSKYALEGILESIGKEVAAFGIHVTAIEPGSFRTDWAGRSMTRAPRTIADYDDLFEPIRDARRNASGRQLGDPTRAAAAVLRILDTPQRERYSAGCSPSCAPDPCSSLRHNSCPHINQPTQKTANKIRKQANSTMARTAAIG